jgi:allantoinase
MRTRFTNLRLPAKGDATVDAEILVRDGRIETATPEGDIPLVAGTEEVVDLGSALVLPGVIDTHVHFDEPGFTHRENFETGTRAAAAGGVTCVVDMPCTTLPPVTRTANLRHKLRVVAPRTHVDFMLWGGVSDNALADPAWRRNLAGLVEEGVASIKVYMLSGMDTFRDLSHEQIREVLGATAELGIPVGVHAEDRERVRELTRELRAAGRDGPLDYAASRPAEVETAAVAALAEHCRATGGRVHVVHVGAGAALDVVAAARAEGLPMSAETCPHFLEFTEGDLAAQGALLKTAPVVKSAADRDRLWQGLAAGDVGWVATDHAAGQWPEEKCTGSIWTDYGGVPGVELLLPYLYSEGVRRGRVTLERLTELTAAAPARFLGVEHRKGRIAPGLDADFVVFDEEERWTVEPERLHNLNRYTPLAGRTLTGRVRSAYLRGQRVYHRRGDGTESFAPPGTGQWLRRPARPV